MQGSLVLRSRVVDELQSAKEVYYCANNLEKRGRREVRTWGREEKREKKGCKERGRWGRRRQGRSVGQVKREGSEEKG